MDGLEAFLLLAVVISVFVYGLRPFDLWRLRHIPGPRGIWLLGNALDVNRSGAHRVFQPWIAQFGPVFKAVIASWSAVVVADADIAREVLRGVPERPPTQPISEMAASFRQEMAYSLLFANGTLWQRLRSAWHPIFIPKRLEGYKDVMEERAGLLVKELHAQLLAGQDVVDIHSAVGDLAFDVIARAGLGWDTKAQRGGWNGGQEDVDWQELRRDAATIFKSAASSSWVRLYAAFPALLPAIRAVNWLLPDPLMAEVFAARKRLMKQLSIFLLSRDAAPSKAFNHLVRESLEGEAEHAPNTAAIQLQQALLMVLAGYETSSSTLAFACHLLARPENMAQQQALAREVGAASGDVMNLPYLDAVVKETLRVLPPAHLTVRRAHRPLEIGGFRVPKGQWMMVPIYAIHRDTRTWGPDADQFRPERWLTDCPQQREVQRRCFMPFGDGGRRCPGSRFALLEVKITLFRLLQDFTLELAAPQEPLELRTSMTMGPANGVHLKLARRVPAS